MSEKLITPREAAESLGVSRYAIYRWILSGKLPAQRVVGCYRLRLADVQSMLKPVPKPAPRKALPEKVKGRRLREQRAERILKEAGIL